VWGYPLPTPSPLGMGSEEGAVPPPRKIFGLLILKQLYLVHSEVFFKVYIPIFACHFCDWYDGAWI